MPKQDFDGDSGVPSQIGLFAGYGAVAGGVGSLILNLVGFDIDLKRVALATAMGAATITAVTAMIDIIAQDQKPSAQSLHAHYVLYVSSAALAGLIGGLEMSLFGLNGETPLSLEKYATAPAAGVGIAIAALTGAHRSFIGTI